MMMEQKSEWLNRRRTQLAIVGFEDGRVPQTHKCGWPLELGKIKEMDSLLELPESNTAQLTS
jgi:hypothetical protein